MANPTPLNVPSPQAPKTLVPLAGVETAPITTAPPRAEPVLTPAILTQASVVIPSYNPVVLAKVPQTFWPLSDASGTTAVDISGNGRNGTITLPATLGVVGLLQDQQKAIRFSTDALAGILFNGATGLGAGAKSFEIWLNSPLSYASFGNLVGVGDGGGVIDGFFINNDGQVACGDLVGGGGGQVVLPAGTIVPNRTYYVAVTIDGTTTRIYINGVLAGSTLMTIGVITGLVIGGLASGADIEGTFEKFATYDFELSAAQVMSNYQAGLAMISQPTLAVSAPPTAEPVLTPFNPTQAGGATNVVQ